VQVEEQPYQIGFGVRAARPVLRFFVRLITRTLMKITITGMENVPLGQTYLVAANHISLFDGPIAIAFWPEIVEVMGASDIWNKPGQNLLARWYGAIKVHRGQYDRELIDSVLKVLRSGRPLLLAPEGGRSHTPGLRRAKPGVGFLIDAGQVPVIPVGLTGTTEDMFSLGLRGKRPLVTMQIGKPLTLPPIEAKGAERRLTRQYYADLVMAHIAGLLPEDYRGVYAREAVLQDDPVLARPTPGGIHLPYR
jgi:1-acyl-sn-glycerol-3-phosphate acyltransferase